MATSTKTRPTPSSALTKDHDVICDWAKKRDGVPATVAGTQTKGDVGMLRLKFQDTSSKNLEEITWEQFFQKFDQNDLQLLYQEKTRDGKLSRFFKFVSGKGRTK